MEMLCLLLRHYRLSLGKRDRRQTFRQKLQTCSDGLCLRKRSIVIRHRLIYNKAIKHVRHTVVPLSSVSFWCWQALHVVLTASKFGVPGT
jgi:hypothetical protein